MHTLTAHGSVDFEPLVVLDKLLVDIADAIQRSGLLPLAVTAFAQRRVVDLYFESLVGKSALLISRVEINSRVAIVLRIRFHREFEITEIRAVHRPGVEEMGARAISGKYAVDRFPGFFVFARTPVVHALAVEEFHPTFFG